MSLIIEPDHHSKDWLVDQLKGLREELSRTHQMLSNDSANRPNPAAVELAKGITGESVALADAVLEVPGASEKLVARAVNQLYEVRNGLPLVFRAANSAPPPFPSPVRRPTPTVRPMPPVVSRELVAPRLSAARPRPRAMASLAPTRG
jgi:hypothetical protein